MDYRNLSSFDGAGVSLRLLDEAIPYWHHQVGRFDLVECQLEQVRSFFGLTLSIKLIDTYGEYTI